MEHVRERLRADASRLPPASIRSDARRCGRDFIAFHAGFPTELGVCVPRRYWLTIGERV